MPKRLEDINFEEKFDFSDKLEFKEGEVKGSFEGVLVKYNAETLAHGIFNFAEDSLKANDGKDLFILYQHDGYSIPVGKMVGKSDKEGFKVKAQLDLSQDENGNYLNTEAVKLYSLMKNMGVNFELSVGGWIVTREITEKDDKRYVNIKEFDAYEGSIVMRGAVKGSKITKTFKEETEGGKMDKKELELLLNSMFAKFSEEMLKAQSDEEIKAIPGKFAELESKFGEVKAQLDTSISEKFEKMKNDLNEVISGLKQNYTATIEEVDDATAFYSMLKYSETKGVGVENIFDANTEIQNFATPTTGNTPNAIKPEYVTRILERLQKKNDVMGRVTFLPTSDNSLFIPREQIGLPVCGIVGETGTRNETDGISLDNVTINMYQFYCMPFVSNRLLATNFVGYLNFLMMRVEYAWSLFVSNKMFTGTGTGEPFGILKDTNITEKELSLASTDEVLADFIIDTYYSVRTEIANNSTWDMTRATWAKIAKIKNTQKDFYITDLNTGNTRTLMGRPVNIIEDTALSDFGTASAGDFLMTFGYWGEGMLGLVNNNLNIRIEDRITSKGVTKYYMEKLLGWGVQLPENFIRVKAKA